MKKEQCSSVQVGDILYHKIYEKNIVVTRIITNEDILNGWIGDFEYRLENKNEPNDTDSWSYVKFLK